MDIVFVLVDTARSENLGGAARALKTMGFLDLRVAAPGDLDDERVRAVAHGSSDIVDRIAEYPALQDAVADCDLVVATTARRRGTRHEYFSSRKLAGYLKERRRMIHRCAVVFGGEESGLSNEQLSFAQVVTSIDLRSEHPSLNLAQAVMVYAYELSPLALDIRRRTNPRQNEGSIRSLQEKTRSVLDSIGIERDALYLRILERVTLAGGIDARLLHSFTNRLIRFLGDRTETPDSTEDPSPGANEGRDAGPSAGG